MSKWWAKMKPYIPLRRDLPVGLEKPFEEFKDIRSIDRLQVAAWLGLFLTFCLFGLDYSRIANGTIHLPQYHYYHPLIYVHALGLLFIIPAVHITRRKVWIIQTRLRRGIVIWGMVLLTFAFLLTQALIVYYHRGTTTVYLGFIFTGSWMFAMSHKERTLFFLVSLTAILWCILVRPDDLFNIGIELSPSEILDARIVSFIEAFVLSIVAFFFDAYDYNQKLENFLGGLQIEKEQKRITELESFKSRFFTNLTHEFRTPLTTIIGMSREIAESPARWAKEGTDMIRQNAGNLLNLINQVLSISKLEAGSLPLHMVQGDIVSFTGYIVDSLRGTAVSKNITLHFLCQEDQIYMDYDPDQYTTLLTNLISNAIKFSPVNENVYISLHRKTEEPDDHIEISVKDNGIGIPKAELEMIFERFYQVNNEVSSSGIGTGVGLAMVKELTQLLGGKISVTSSIGKGAQFTVSLPIRHTAKMEGDHVYQVNDLTYTSSSSDAFQSASENIIDEDSSNKPEVLIIEDNEDVLKYLQICLGDLYHLMICKDGEEGVTTAINRVPDLILSDVMMPMKDGLTVSRELKHNPVTSHIPIILLSAKSDVASRIAGLESGADIYMTKPFEKDELRIQIQNLLNRFKEYHLRYANPETIPPQTQDVQLEVEDEFITRIRNLVHEHLDDSDFSVHDLERGVFLSRSQLHKKLKALTGLSTMQFVSRIRLSVARDKLKSADKTISDIAYEVGFSDPNYFSRAYSEEFGESPSETRNRLKKNGL